MPARSRSLTRITALGAAGLLTAGLLGVVAAPAYAVTFPVTNAAELAAAIDDANADPDLDTIQINASFALAVNLPTITEDLIIEGNGNTITGAGSNAFDIDGVDQVEIRNLTITGAFYSIFSNASGLTLDGVTITGGILDGLEVWDGTLSVTDSVFTQNTTGGATISVNGGPTEVTITGSTFDENGGTGLSIDGDVDDSTFTVTDTTMNDNAENGFGFDFRGDSSLALTRVTANGNGQDGFDIRAEEGVEATLTDLTADGNGDDGFELSLYDDVTLTATGLSAAENDSNGFQISTDDDVVGQISDSVFDDNLDNGVDAEVENGGELTFTRVDTRGNDDDGYQVRTRSGSRVTIAETNIADNGDLGLHGNIGNSELDVLASTISGNTVGAIFYGQDDALIFIGNSTVSGNGPGSLQSLGVGGIFFDGSDAGTLPEAVIANSTITNNSSGWSAPGVGLIDFVLLIQNSILAGNAEWDLATGGEPAEVAIEHSLVQSAFGDSIVTTAIAAGIGNLTGVDPLLGPLADNGGRTLTHLPQAGSPVIDAGDPAFSAPPTQDQRGQARVQNSRLDMGSVERPAPSGGGDGGLADSGGPDILAPALGIAGLLLILGAVLLFLRVRRRRVAA